MKKTPSGKAAILMFVATMASASGTQQALAQDAEAFFKGRTISILMGTGPGGSYGLYGRVIATHIAKHIPGKPNIIIENMPGAGGANAGNFIYANAPQDGSKILMTHALPLIEKLSGRKNLKFKSDKFQWIGSFGEITQVLTLWHSAPAKTLAEVKTAKNLVLGTMGNSHLSYQWASLLKLATGAPYKIITGYTNGGAINLAMERGEVHGWTVAYESIAGSKPKWISEKKVNMLVSFTLERLQQLPDVPTLIELMPKENRDIAQLLAAGTPIARGLTYGPNVPKERVAAVRSAFDAMMKDKDFIAEAAKRQLALRYRSAGEVQKLVETITSASPELVARTMKAVGAK
jgi:tripartite-type tricarboxylate transporter receptor subunit TctC